MKVRKTMTNENKYTKEMKDANITKQTILDLRHIHQMYEELTETEEAFLQKLLSNFDAN